MKQAFAVLLIDNIQKNVICLSRRLSGADDAIIFGDNDDDDDVNEDLGNPFAELDGNSKYIRFTKIKFSINSLMMIFPSCGNQSVDLHCIPMLGFYYGNNGR